ncbi:MAG: DUF421 domain-containing protein [Bacillota bacterium]|nr:DUF421 domain-containing protein [Bacillota bacterium]
MLPTEAIYLAIIIIRTLILYFTILVSMRLVGKRQLGEMEISELIVAALVADLAASPLQDIGIPLLNGLIPIAVLFCLEVIISGLSIKSVRLRGFIFGRPSIIISDGKICIPEMRKNRFTPDELLQELRSQSVNDITTVEYAILETGGQLNIILKADYQPLTAQSMGISLPDTGYPHVIINQGRILSNNLRLLGRDEKWLSKQLGGKLPRDIYLFTLTETGTIFCQAKESE